MRIGQKSFIHFVSKIGATVAGFLATIYFARVLGASILGTYFLVIAVLTWLKMFSTMGVSKAVNKRVSEAEEADSFFTAGLGLQVASLLIISGLVFLFQNQIVAYTGFARIEVLVLLVIASSLFTFVTSVLVGEGLAHVSGALDPLDRIARTLAQVSLVLAGFELLGMFVGYVLASLITAGVGAYFVSSRLEKPKKRHFRSLWNYAKYSWLGKLSNRTLASMDTIILGIFVTSDLIGIYEIAWNIASVFAVFGGSINQSIFPEISRLGVDNPAEVSDLAEDGVAYAGLFLIPGLVGAVVLGEVILAVYSPEFRQGYTVLLILVFARLISIYMSQFLNVVDALDKPDISFRINAVFVVTNISLNLVLVYLYGWVGAAVATTASALIGFTLGYRAISTLIEFQFPVLEVAKQLVAACTMGVVVYGGAELLSYQRVPSLLLVPLGAALYFGTLLILSQEFRSTIRSNVSV